MPVEFKGSKKPATDSLMKLLKHYPKPFHFYRRGYLFKIGSEVVFLLQRAKIDFK